MPAVVLGVITVLVLVLAVWASVTQESDTTMIGESEPDWGIEPSEQEELRKAS